MSGMDHHSDELIDPTENDPAVIDRRGLFKLGGLGVAAAAILAACDNVEDNEIGRVGVGEPDHLSLEDLNCADRLALGVDDGLPLTSSRQGLLIELPLHLQ